MLDMSQATHKGRRQPTQVLQRMTKHSVCLLFGGVGEGACSRFHCDRLTSRSKRKLSPLSLLLFHQPTPRYTNADDRCSKYCSATKLIQLAEIARRVSGIV